MRVYFRDQNPSVDHFAFKQSAARAAEMVAAGEGEYIFLSDGHEAVQLYRNQASRDDSWIERLEEVSKTASAPMPYLKIRWPERVKALRAASQISNVRQLVTT